MWDKKTVQYVIPHFHRARKYSWDYTITRDTMGRNVLTTDDRRALMKLFTLIDSESPNLTTCLIRAAPTQAAYAYSSTSIFI